MEIVEIIKPKENVKEFIEEKLKKAIKEVTPYKKPLVQSPKITRFFSQHTYSKFIRKYSIFRLSFFRNKTKTFEK